MPEPDVLDAAGGTDIFQMAPGRVRLTAGADAVRCLRLRDTTAVLRWYTECCRTPVANTAGPRFPVIGLIHSFMGEAADGRFRDEALGPPACRIYERSAIRPLPPTARRRHRSRCSPAADRSCWAGGCAGLAGRTRSSTRIAALRFRRHACSRPASAPPFERRRTRSPD